MTTPTATHQLPVPDYMTGNPPCPYCHHSFKTIFNDIAQMATGGMLILEGIRVSIGPVCQGCCLATGCVSCCLGMVSCYRSCVDWIESWRHFYKKNMITPIGPRNSPPPAIMWDPPCVEVTCRVCSFCLGAGLFSWGTSLCVKGWMYYTPWLHNPMIPGALLCVVSGPCLWYGCPFVMNASEHP